MYSSATRSPRDRSRWYPDIVPKTQKESSHSRGFSVMPAALLGFVGLVALGRYYDNRRVTSKSERHKANGVEAPVIGGPFRLVNTENQVLTEQDLRGNWVLLYFGYTFSPDIGPDQVSVMAKAIGSLELKGELKVLPIFVTIDPQRDTPSHLRAYLKEFDARIVGLTGSARAVRHIAQAYRVFFRKIEEEGDDYLIESSHNMYLINPNMEVARSFGIEYNAVDLADAILRESKRFS